MIRINLHLYVIVCVCVSACLLQVYEVIPLNAEAAHCISLNGYTFTYPAISALHTDLFNYKLSIGIFRLHMRARVCAKIKSFGRTAAMRARSHRVTFLECAHVFMRTRTRARARLCVCVCVCRTRGSFSSYP